MMNRDAPRQSGGVEHFPHTRCPGLVRFALDDARRRGLKVIAICPYVQQYLVRHPEDRDIVVGQAPG